MTYDHIDPAVFLIERTLDIGRYEVVCLIDFLDLER